MKIAIISNFSHIRLSGIEIYNKNLIRFLLNNNHQVDEYFTKKINQTFDSKIIVNSNYELKNDFVITSWFQNFLFFYKIKKKIILMSKKYDLIIISANHVFNHLIFKKNKNIVFVQHFDEKMYKNSLLPIKNLLMKSLLSLITPLNFFRTFLWSANSVIFYDPIAVPQKSKVKNKFYSVVPCDLQFFEPKNLEAGQKIVYIGRLDQKIKQIKKIVFLAKRNANIEIYGHGKYAKKIKKYSFFKGVASREQILEIFKNTKLLLLPSKSEGAALIISEAAACGVPTLCFNYWKMAYFWEKQNIAILSTNWQEYQQKLSDFQKLKDKQILLIKKDIISKNKNIIDLKSFEIKWKKVIDFFQKFKEF